MHPLNPSRSSAFNPPTSAPDGKTILATCESIADLMEVLHGEAAASQGYREAATVLRQLVAENADAVTPEVIDRIFEGHAAIASGARRDALEATQATLKAQVPDSILEMLPLPGLGPKRLHTIWKELGIVDAANLYHAATENRLLHQKGFGPKTQEKILASLQQARCRRDRFGIGDLMPVAARMEGELRQLLGAQAKLDFVGDYRRGMPECAAIEFLVEPDHYRAIMLHLIKTPDYELMTASADMLQGRLRDSEIPFVFQFKAVNYYLELFRRSGSPVHVDLIPVDERHSYQSEAEIYEEAGLPWMAPELREGKEEVKMALARRLPQLVTREDICGLMHVHSTYSDGSDRLETLALRCIAMGMQYLVLTDHGPGHDGKCMTLESIAQQHREIDRLNQKLAPFRIFKGVEAEIHADGSLGMPAEVLASFDFVIAALHLQAGITQADATIRILKAIQNPYTTMIGHLSGRKVFGTACQPLDVDLLIDTCATHGVALELNCHPSRMDLDWKWIRYAISKGVQIGINPNAHSAAALADYEAGVRVARKGMVSAAACVNAQDVEAFAAWIGKRSRRHLG